MHSSKTFERRTFLVSTTALIAGCTADGGGAEADASSSGSESTSGGGTNTTTSTQPTSTTNESTASTTGSSSTSSSATVSSSSASSDTSSGSDMSSAEEEPPADDACFEGGGTDAGMGQDAGGGVCSTNTDNGNHCHPLFVPQSDVDAGFAEVTYTLEDGGTGHTHTVTLTAYDALYLQAGLAHEVRSSTDAGHDHVCLITCAS